MDELTSVYIQECREQLADMEAGLLRLEQAPEDRDNLNGIFRAAHTIKGGAGVIECRFIEHFTHGVENLLDALRNGDFAVTGGMATLLLECCDQMVDLIDVLAAQSTAPDADVQARGDALTQRLGEILAANQGNAGPSASSLRRSRWASAGACSRAARSSCWPAAARARKPCGLSFSSQNAL